MTHHKTWQVTCAMKMKDYHYIQGVPAVRRVFCLISLLILFLMGQIRSFSSISKFEKDSGTCSCCCVNSGNEYCCNKQAGSNINSRVCHHQPCLPCSPNNQLPISSNPGIIEQHFFEFKDKNDCKHETKEPDPWPESLAKIDLNPYIIYYSKANILYILQLPRANPGVIERLARLAVFRL